MWMEWSMQNNIEIFQSSSGEIVFNSDAKHETIWASLDQIAKLFNRDKSGISRHINNIFKSEELEKDSTVAKIATVQTEGKREVVRCDYLYKSNGEKKINENALTTLTLLVASSNPKEKELLVKLIKHLIFESGANDEKQ